MLQLAHCLGSPTADNMNSGAAHTSVERVRKRLPSSPSTSPKPTWLTRGPGAPSGGRMPALRAAANTSLKWLAWPSSVM